MKTRLWWGGLVLLGVLSSASAVHAVTRTLTWKAPLTNTDGTPASVGNYMMYRSSNNGLVFVKQLPLIAGDVLTYTDTDVPTGEVCYEVTAWNANGESARSNRVCFSVPSAPPTAPTALSASGAVAPVTPQGKKK